MLQIAWYDDPQQVLIDTTLDERVTQLTMCQLTLKRLNWRFADQHSDEQAKRDETLAWEHLSLDIRLLQPFSSVPF